MDGSQLTPSPPSPPSPRSNFRKFFVRGMAILLPSVLTIWILIAAYQFVQGYIAEPINTGLKQVILSTGPWPRVTEQGVDAHLEEVLTDPERRRSYRAADSSRAWLREDLRWQKLESWWGQYAIALDLIGLVVAIVLIYMAGLLLGSFIGRRLYQRGEYLLHRLPLVGRVYPAVKQVTDFFLGDHPQRLNFNRVVAVEYPRKGLWSVGLVTGATMQTIQERAAHDCLTVFIPSSPTPFTGYVITVPKRDTIDLPITIEDAMKFAVSAGVLIPPNQVIPGTDPPLTTDDADSAHAAPEPQMNADEHR